METVGFHLFPAQGGEGIAEIGCDENIVGGLGEEAGPEPDFAGGGGKGTGGVVPLFLKKSVFVVNQ